MRARNRGLIWRIGEAIDASRYIWNDLLAGEIKSDLDRRAGSICAEWWFACCGSVENSPGIIATRWDWTECVAYFFSSKST